MADIYKVATGSSGPGGTPIFDVFEGERKIELPEFQQRGLNIDQLRLGQAPTGFQSQFLPVNIDVKPEIPASVLEQPPTQQDLYKMMIDNQANLERQRIAQENLNNQNTAAVLQKMQLTPEEKTAQERLLGLQQLQTQAMQQVQERPLDGTALRAGLQSEISNISTGQTRESLANLRQQTFEAERLQVLQGQRQQELEGLKLQLEQGNINTENLFKYQQLQQEQQQVYLDRVQQLTNNARTSLGTILDRFQGLTLDSLSPQNLAQITALAQQAGIPIDILRDGMKAVADQIQADQDIKRYQAETSRMSKGGSSGVSGPIESWADLLSRGEASISNVPSNIRNSVVSYLGDQGIEINKPLSETAITHINQTNFALSSLNDLRAIIQNNLSYVGPISGLQKYNPYSKARQVQSDIDRIRQTVGKALEGGVLRKEDEDKYKRILATITDTPETATYKIDALISSLSRDIEDYKQAQSQSGRYIPDINLSAETLRSKYGY